MWNYEKRLQYPVKITNPNPKIAQCILSQYGGPDGEMGASMRYLSQRYSMPYRKVSGLLTDIGTDAAVQKNREKERLTNRMLSYTIPSLTVGKQKTVVKPVKSMLAAVFCFVAICAIVLYFYTMVNLFLLSA